MTGTANRHGRAARPCGDRARVRRPRLRGWLAGAAASIVLAGCASAQSAGDGLAAGVEMPPSPMGHYLAGRFAADQRDLDRAAELLSVALAADPENTELLRETYLAMVSAGRTTEAEDLARRLIAAGVEDGPARMTLAFAAVDAGDYAAARDHLARMPTEGFNSFVVPLLQAWVTLGADGVDPALALAESLQEIRGLEPVRGIHHGLIAELGDRPAEAASGFASALEVAGTPPFRMVDIIGNYYERVGRRDEARALYEQFVAANPGTVLAESFEGRPAPEAPPPLVGDISAGLAEMLFDAASVLRQEQVTDVALIYTRMALDLKPDLVIARLLLADILEEQERHEDAIAVYRSLPQDVPLSWQGRLNLADLLDRSERTDEAIALLRGMIAERPEQVDPPLQLGNLYRIHQRFEEAVEAYDIAAERLGMPTPARWPLFYFRGIANERSGNWEAAERDFLTALELSPDHPYVLNYLAYSWIEQGLNYDRALDMLEEAVTLRPGDGFIVDSLGWVYYRLGKYEEAVEQLERANELMPTDPVLNDHLGDAYWRVGRRTEARYQWRRALQFSPEDDQIPVIQAKIEEGLAEPPPAPSVDSASGS